MNEEINNLNLNEIKEILKERNLSLKGTKRILLERLKNSEKEKEKEEKEEKEEVEVEEEEKEQKEEEKEEKKEEEKNIENLKEELNLKTLNELKEMLKERDLSVNGKKEILINRLALRLEKEKDPLYVAKPKKKIKICEWCGAYMIKRNGRKGEFYGCASYPDCQYTTSLSGYAKPSREVLRGVSAPFEDISCDRLQWARRRGEQKERRERDEERREEKMYRDIL